MEGYITHRILIYSYAVYSRSRLYLYLKPVFTGALQPKSSSTFCSLHMIVVSTSPTSPSSPFACSHCMQIPSPLDATLACASIFLSVGEHYTYLLPHESYPPEIEWKQKESPLNFTGMVRRVYSCITKTEFCALNIENTTNMCDVRTPL